MISSVTPEMAVWPDQMNIRDNRRAQRRALDYVGALHHEGVASGGRGHVPCPGQGSTAAVWVPLPRSTCVTGKVWGFCDYLCGLRNTKAKVSMPLLPMLVHLVLVMSPRISRR